MAFVENYFSQFPRQPFLNLEWEENIAESKQKLLAQNYHLVVASETKNLVNNSDNTEVIFNELSTELNQFKVFIKSPEGQNKKASFLEFFSSRATKTTQTKQYSIFHFETDEDWFKISIYEQDSFLRFEFVLQETH